MTSQRSMMWLACVMMLLAVVLRVAPHPDNVTPIVAMALFGGALFPRRWALIIPLAAMILSDALIGFHRVIPFTWGGMVLIAVIGLWVRQQFGWRRIIIGSVAGSTLFFLLTNFGVWWMGHGQWYPRTWAGLTDCYIAAIPFYRQALLGDVGYAGLFFVAYHLAAARLVQRPAVGVSST